MDPHSSPAMPHPVPVAASAAEWLVGNADSESMKGFILSLAHERPSLVKGFSATSSGANAPVVRKRLASLLSREPLVAGAFVQTCAGPWTDVAELLAILPMDWLLVRWRSLTRRCASPLIPAALTQHEDDRLVRRGCKMLSKDGCWRAPPKRVKKRDLALLAPLEALCAAVPEPTTATAPAEPITSPSPSPSSSGIEKRLRRELRQKKDELQELREANRKREQTLRRELKQSRGRVRELEEQYDRLQADLERRAQQRLNAYRRDTLQLSNAQERPRALDGTPAGSHAEMIREADRLLDDQALRDEKYGTRANLRRQREETRHRLERVLEATGESLSPHPRLGSLRERLTEHLAVLDNRLTSTVDQAPEPARSFLREIHGVAADDTATAALDALQQAVRQPAVRSMLGTEWFRALEVALGKRREHVQRLLSERTIAEDVVASDGGAPREIFNVAGALRRVDPARLHLIVDAYNLLLQTPSPYGDGRTVDLPAMRNRFERLCRRRLSEVALVQIVYDGTDPALQSRHKQGNLLVCFAPRREPEQNADNLIVSRLREAAPELAIRWLVTDDAGLRARTRELCEAFLSTEALDAFLRA